MSFLLFTKSIRALSPWFRKFFKIGGNHSQDELPSLFTALRDAGIAAEAAMFEETGGVNTHKGFVFLSAAFCGALGALSAKTFSPRLSDVLALCSLLGDCSQSDFRQTDSRTFSNGILCYRKFHLLGVRGELSRGFPTVVEVILPTLRQWLSKGSSVNEASAAALLAAIASTQDTNMIKRSSFSAAQKRQQEAAALLASATNDNLISLLTDLDASYIAEHLSPGGCADLLAIGWMLLFMNQEGLITL